MLRTLLYKFNLFIYFIFLISKSVYSQKTIVEIIERNCLHCHNKQNNPGIIFNRLSDIKERGKTIEYLLQKNIMPKTHSNLKYSTFSNETYISKEDKEAILEYIRYGKSSKQKLNLKEINQKEKLKKIVFKSNLVSKGTNEDNFAIIKIPYKLKIEKQIWVTGYEIKTSSPKEFHHIGLFLLKKDERNIFIDKGLNQFYYNSKITPSGEDSLANIYHIMKIIPKNQKFFWDWMVFKTEWQIGGGKFIFPKNTGFFLPKEGAVLLNNVHLRPTPLDKKLSVEITLYYEEDISDYKDYLYVIDIANTQEARIDPPLKIPAGKIQKHTLTTVLPGDMVLYTVSPHMHYLGKTFESYAIQPNGERINLIQILNWDPDWMKTYQFEKPINLKAGTIIYCIGTYDNTSNNPRNPNVPPRDVNNLMMFRDEMLNMIISFTSLN